MKTFKQFLENTAENLNNVSDDLRIMIQDAINGETEVLPIIRHVLEDIAIPEEAVQRLLDAIEIVKKNYETKRNDNSDYDTHETWLNQVHISVDSDYLGGRSLYVGFGRGGGYLNGLAWFCVFNGWLRHQNLPISYGIVPIDTNINKIPHLRH